MDKAWIWTNRGFLAFPGNLRVRVRVKARVRCVWFVLMIHVLVQAIHGLSKSVLCA